MQYERPYWQVKPPDVTRYEATYTLTKFHLDQSEVRGIMGPLGSGKSTGCCWDIMQKGFGMQRVTDGARRSRWAVIRNTYRELEDTTLQTWFDWFPEADFGRFLRRGMTHEVRRTLPDGTKMELDVLFRALDKPQDVRKLLSLELTGAWINEAKEVPRAVLDMLRKRVGRYPAWDDHQPYWNGVIMDTNPPEEDSWYYKLAETDHSGEFGFYRQPSGRSPQAENLTHLKPNYYSTAGYTDQWIKVYIDGEYGYIQAGKAIYPEFYEQLHFVADLQPIRAAITVGLDFGLTPAAAFIQTDARGRYLVIDELCTRELTQDVMGATQFAKELARKIHAEYPDYEFRFVGDPAGDERSQLDSNQCVFDVLRANGINARPAPTQDWILRRDAIGVPLNTLVDGRPGLIIGGKCRMIRMGLAGKYNYKRIQVVGDERYHNKPDKNDYSHPVEALQYGLLACGSNPARPRSITSRQRATFQAETKFNPWEACILQPNLNEIMAFGQGASQ